MAKTYSFTKLEDTETFQTLNGLHMIRSHLGRCALPLFSRGDFFVLRTVKSGAEHYKIDNKRYTVAPKSLLITPPWIHGHVDVQADTHGTCVYLPADDVAQLYQEASSADIAGSEREAIPLQGSVLLPTNDGSSLGRYMASLGECRIPLDNRLLMELTEGLLRLRSDLGKVAAVKDSTKAEVLRRIRMAYAYLKEHTHRELSLGEVAKECGLSRYHLIRNFRDLYGMPPMRAHQNMRLDNARQKIESGSTPTEVALAMGFDNPANFSRAFLRRHGLRPSAIAK